MRSCIVRWAGAAGSPCGRTPEGALTACRSDDVSIDRECRPMLAQLGDGFRRLAVEVRRVALDGAGDARYD